MKSIAEFSIEPNLLLISRKTSSIVFNACLDAVKLIVSGGPETELSIEEYREIMAPLILLARFNPFLRTHQPSGAREGTIVLQTLFAELFERARDLPQGRAVFEAIEKEFDSEIGCYVTVDGTELVADASKMAFNFTKLHVLKITNQIVNWEKGHIPTSVKGGEAIG